MTGSVLVVGGGIAGRAVARVLARHRVECTVVERRREPVGLGMGLNLPGNAVRALGDLGITEHALARGMPVLRREYRNRQDRLLFATDDEEFWGEVARPWCLRHGHLMAALDLPREVTVQHASAATATPSPDGVEVELAGADHPRRFAFVVGADGVHSSMRAAVTDDRVRPSSMTGSSWRFVGPNPGVGSWTAWSGSDVTFLMIPVQSGRVYGYASRTRGGDTGPDATWLTAAADGFPNLVRAAVAQAVAGGELHRASVDEVRTDRWHRGRLTLIGDAAHATGPVWAQGVAMAVEDALVLGRLLGCTPVDDWAGIGARFERLRRPRVTHVQNVTDRMAKLAALPEWMRDTGVRVLGARSYRSAYGPLRHPYPIE